MLSLLGLRAVKDRGRQKGCFLLLACCVLLSACASQQVGISQGSVDVNEEAIQSQSSVVKPVADSLEMFVYPTEASEEGYQVVIDL